VPTPTDPMGFLKSTRDFRAPSAAKEHTNEVRGGGHDPGVRRLGAGLGQSPARTKIFRAAMHAFLSTFFRNCTFAQVRPPSKGWQTRMAQTAKCPKIPKILQREM